MLKLSISIKFASLVFTEHVFQYTQKQLKWFCLAALQGTSANIGEARVYIPVMYKNKDFETQHRLEHSQCVAMTASPSRTLCIRPAGSADLEQLHRLQLASYPPAFHEHPAVFSTIIEHGMSLVAEEASTERLVGYALCHCATDPSRPPALSEAPEPRGSTVCWTDHVFIHDVSVEVRLICMAL
jgi:hypothetical protein